MIDNRNNLRFSADDLIVLFALIVTVVTGAAIAHSDSTLFSPVARQVGAYIRIISVCMMVFLTISYKRYSFSKLLLVPVVFCLFRGLDTYSSSDEHLIEAGMTFIRLTALLWLKPQLLARLFKTYRKVLIVMSGLGIICYFWYALKLPGIYNVVNYYTGANTGAYYINFKICYLFSEGSILRLCGFFNEPGYLGTVVGLVLCAEKFDVKKKGNIVLLVAGLLSLSVAFFFICVIYHTLKLYKRPKLLIPLVLLLVAYLTVIPIIGRGSGALATFAARIALTENGISAAKRTNDIIDMIVINMATSANAVFGYGHGYISTLNIRAGLNFKLYIVMYGFVGFFVIFAVPLKILISKYKHCAEAIFLILCVFISVYQRPDIFNYTYMVILIGGAEKIIFENSFEEITQ